MEIVRDEADRERFLDALFVLNDEYQNDNWVRDLEDTPRFIRPGSWPDAAPLVDILAYTLLDNHMHLLVQLRDENENGLADFARRLFRSMTGHFNEKYREKGSIFQGPYKKVPVESDEQLRYVAPYILLKNTLEMHPAGLDYAGDFDSAWEWAKNYRYSSLGALISETPSPLLPERAVLADFFGSESELKDISRDMLEAFRERRKEFRPLQLED